VQALARVQALEAEVRRAAALRRQVDQMQVGGPDAAAWGADFGDAAQSRFQHRSNGSFVLSSNLKAVAAAG
jgi:hypothetical protein